METFSLQALADQSTSSSGTVYGIYGVVAALGVALIYGVVTLITTRWTTGRIPPSARVAQRIGKERDAFERFILLQTQADPRKIKTGFESMTEVSRAP